MNPQPPDSGLLRQESLICARCGTCREVCPVYEAVGWESASPRGRMSVVREVFADESKVGVASPEQVRTLGRCTLCGACATSCTTMIDTRSLWLEARSALVKEGGALEEYGRIATLLDTHKNVASLANEGRLDWAEDLDDVEVEPNVQGVEVCYFVGCVTSFYPRASQVALAFAEILNAAGVDFTVLGGEEWCCGFPLVAAGFVEQAEAFRAHNVERIVALGAKKVVSTCPSCFHSLEKESSDALRDAGVEVMHATQFLLELLEKGRIRPRELPAVVTYHDPCDLGRNVGVYDEPRAILRLIPGVEFVEMERHGAESACCGGGGNLQSVDAGLTERIADARVKESARSGAGILLSACQQCEQVLEAAVRRRGLPMRVMDVCELLAERVT